MTAKVQHWRGGPKNPWEPTPERLKLIRECGKLGLNYKLTSRAVGISYETWNVKVNKFPDILKAWDEGRAEGAKIVSGCLFQNATEPAMGKDGPTAPPAGSVAAQTAYLKQVADWQDKQEVTLTPGSGAIPVQIVLPANGREVGAERAKKICRKQK